MAFKKGVRFVDERLKQLRKKLGLTQQEFADRLNIKRGAVANYEIGRNVPIDAVVSLICQVFNVRREWLLDGEGTMFQPEPVDELDALLKDRGFSEADRILVKNFLALSDAGRNEVMQFVVRSAAEIIGTGSYGSVPFQVYDRETWIKAMDFYQRALHFGGSAKTDMEIAEAEADALAEKAAQLTREQMLSEKKPGSPASSAKESGVG